MAYADLAAELSGTIPGLSPILASTYIRRSWRDIRDQRNWSFKTAQSSLICPPVTTAGSAGVIHGSTTVTFDLAASVALAKFLSGVPVLNQMQIRFNQGPLYQIETILQFSPLIVTVSRPVTEPNNATTPYMIYRAYVQPPVADFTRWDSLTDYANGIEITNERLTRTSVWFDQLDPQRTSTGQASYLGSLIASIYLGSVGLPWYELWPHPVQGQTFLVTFRRTGPEFNAPTDFQPEVVPDSLIMDRAVGWYAGPWAKANQGRFPALIKIDITGIITAARQAYGLDFNTIRLRDEELALESVYNRGHWGSTRGHRGPVPLGDAKFWQSHPISW